KRPDCVVFLPDQRPLCIDAKFPLEAMTALHDARSDEEKKFATQRLRADVMKHVSDIAEKYLITGETQDTALMFVPSESVYAEIHDGFDDVIQKAYRARVVLVSPSLLMLAIQVMQQILKDARMRDAADQIRTEVLNLGDDLGRLRERVLKLQNHFSQANEDIRQILISADKIEKRAGRIEELDFSKEPATETPRLVKPAAPELFPLALSGSTLQVWMRESGVDLGTIGLFALVGTPYTLKFLWAPLVDALHVPFFTRAFGRRRGWLVFSQLLLIGAILLLALTDPARSPLFVALGALLVATMSSTQDIVVDAFRVESLPESEQAAGMASYVAAYRIGMLISTAGALFIVSGFESTGITRGAAWTWGYVVMAALVLIGTITALVATEPEQSARAEAATYAESAFTRVLHAAVGAFSEFL